MSFKKLVLIPMFMILSTGMPILADETDIQKPVEEQTETILGWNETHDMYTKEDGTFALGWQEIDQEMYYLMNKEFFNVINGSIIIMLVSMVEWLKINGSRIVM